MRAAVLVVACATCLAACADRRPIVSDLQQFDSLRSTLSTVAMDSRQVSADLASLSSSVRQAKTTDAQVEAIHLKAHAVRLRLDAGRAGNAVVTLLRNKPSPNIRTYFRLTREALQAQWYEGSDLAALADLVWRDPLLATDHDSRSLLHVASAARTQAAAAVALTRQAAVIKHRRAREFRYVLVKRPRQA